MTTAPRERHGLRHALSPRSPLWHDRNTRWFLPGYATSLLGSSMAPVALAFAVLREGGGPAELGWVLTARILPLVLVLLLGGVAADRLGSRRVMLAADLLRCLAQALLALLLMTGHPPLWALLVPVVLGGAGEAVFNPALAALIPRIAPAEQLAEANSVLSLIRSTSTVAGPALAGLVAVAAGPGPVLALDAASYAVSVLTLARLRVTLPAPAAKPGLLRELREGWGHFSSRTWLWTTSLHAGAMNLLCWAPYLVLGPVTAERRLGGAGAWGLMTACYGVGAVAGGLLLLARRPGRPLLTATLAMGAFALPSAALAGGAALPWVCAADLAAGLAATVAGTLDDTVVQRLVPPEAQARVYAWNSLGAFALGPLGLAAAGPVAAALGTSTVLGLGAGWQLAATAVVAALPAVRRR
ncbi:MFS transporter [Kitasatospora nipponensis]|uniref:MFS transporter n=1 Tax=Kitasatospora nipponensis TaxID=258049 RepID=A0ABN1WTN5_9ACTN